MNGGRHKIVVVGAGSGIGAAVATHFHDRGDHVLAVDVRDHQTPASERLQCDLRDAASINALLDHIGSGWTCSPTSPASPERHPLPTCSR